MVFKDQPEALLANLPDKEGGRQDRKHTGITRPEKG
jgi:hypothetical protein